MNQIFKVVFNAARGKKMVVNEATSSVQMGKMAAVTVAVVAALGAGSAMAEDWEADGKTVVIDGNTAVTIDGVQAESTVPSGAAVFGGLREQGEANIKNNLADILNSNLTVKGSGTFEDIIGGHYATLGSQGDKKLIVESGNVVLGDLSVTIEGSDVAVTRAVVGGSKIARNSVNGNLEYTHTNLNDDGTFKSGVFTAKTNSTNLEIFGGTFGQDDGKYNGTYGNPEQVVAAGDFIKDIGWGLVQTDSNIGTTNLTIHDGTFNAIVVGGSYAAVYADFHTVVNMNVGTANTVINGGTFNQAIFAGSAIYTAKEHYEQHECPLKKEPNASYLQAHVGVANLTIDGATAQDVYAGGLVQFEEVDDIAQITIGESNLTISNSTVANVYGVTGYSQVGDVDGVRTETVKPTYTDENNVEHKDTTKTGLTLTNTTVANTVDIQDGSVELRVEADGKTSVGTLSLGAKVGVTMSGDGTFNDATGGDIAALSEHITVGEKPADETVKNADLSLDEGAVMGAVTARINENGEIVDKKVAVNDKTDSLTNKVVHIPQIINRIMMNDVRKRMGDIRSAEGTHGAWVRYNGGEMSGRGIDNDFNMIQVGFDTMPGADAPRFGVAFSYANSEAEDGYGTADMDAYSLAAYATKFYDNGMFVDVIGRLAKIDTDLDNVGMTGKMDNLAVSLSGEFGWRFDVTKSLYVEPAVEATYTYMDSDEFTLGQGEYELESTDSFIGRAGFAAGFKCPANKGDVYVRAAVAHEFLGDATMNSSINGHRAAAVELDGKDTWIEFGLGANFNVNESTYVYADVERTEGAAIDEDWRANVGVRFAF